MSIIVNGRELTDQDRKMFLDTYKVEPAPGEYWYDAKSGLWGLAGGPAAGFLLAGHSLGKLEASASNGDSEISLNGRRMQLQEVLAFSNLLGGPILPGRYWLDGEGNYGYEGFDIPAGNLVQVVLARMAQGGGRPGGGGGDNFWYSRFGAAGNYNRDNTVGYVSVPGVGPVSYGM